MNDGRLRRSAASGLGVLALLVASRATGGAQTWQWKYVTRTPNAPPLAAQSTVLVSAGQLSTTYTVPIARRQVVIESCHAALRDVQSATTVQSQGRTFLLVQFKAPATASCASGQRPAIALPTEDERDVTGALEAINRACCSAAAIVAKGTPAATRASPASPAPASPTPAPSPSASPRVVHLIAAADWVERAGTFTFVRVENTGAQPIKIRNIEVFACRSVASGCGASGREFDVDPHAAITVATVASANARDKPAFRYRYTAVHGDDTVARAGSSSTSAPLRAARMSPAQMQTAVVDAPSTLSAPSPQNSGAFAPPRLLKRGSSRLAIGETGTALIRLMIAGNGTPEEATIVSISNRRLAAAAIETAVSSTYAPATQNGKPVTAKYVATFSFDGQDPALLSIPVWKRSPAPIPATAATPADAPLPAPTARAPVPLPSADVPVPSPSADVPVPSPSADVPVPSPSANAPSPPPSAGVPVPSPSAAVSFPPTPQPISSPAELPSPTAPQPAPSASAQPPR